jgi:hypothetical protein
MKLCKDCKWCKMPWILPSRFAMCVAPSSISPVDGRVPEKFCDLERIVGCGHDAKYFEPKE